MRRRILIKRTQSLALLVAAAALLAVPAVGQANHTGNGKGKAKGHVKAKNKCVVNKGFVVKGTLVADATPDYTTSVTINVTGANRHARIGAGFTDADPATPGMQFGQTYTVSPPDTFKLRYSGTGTPSAGDKVRITGKVPVTRNRARCNPAQSLAGRYGDEDIRRVKIVDITP